MCVVVLVCGGVMHARTICDVVHRCVKLVYSGGVVHWVVHTGFGLQWCKTTLTKRSDGGCCSVF